MNVLLAATTASEGTDILCKILLIALIITLVVGLAQAIGVAGDRLAAGVGALGRFTVLGVFLVLLLVYVFFC